jgi:hypothetical protein
MPSGELLRFAWIRRSSRRKQYILFSRGLVVGLVVAIAAALGINLLNLRLQVPAITDAAVFFVAALGSAGRRGAKRVLQLGQPHEDAGK